MNTLNTSGKTSITIDGSVLLRGDYSVSDKDLIISTDSDTVLVKDYFINLPTLVSPQGASLTPKLVSSLSAYQSNEFLAFQDPKAIGEITVTDGPIVITRVGQKIELQQGDFIYLNDFVDVGQNTVGITFKDDTALSLEPGAKMVVDEFYYDPEANQGGMNADVIGGSFSFVSGNIAKVGNDAMTVSTPVLTIGVRGTQVAGRANQEGEDNEIVLLPNADGTVGEISIKNDSGEVILTEAYQATTITSAIMPPTVPVILPKEIVLKKYAKTISTTRKTEKIKEVERETEDATKEKEEAESEKEQLEEEAEELEEEAEQLEEEKEQLEEEAEQLEEEKEQLEEKAEELKEEIAELEEKLENADADEIEEIQEELAEAEQEIEEVEEQVEEVIEEEKVIEQKVEQVEEKVEEVKQEVQQIEQKVEFVEDKIVQVEEKFDAIVEEFEVFQEEFVQEFQDFIPEEEIQQFMEEAPLEIIEEFQEKIIEKLENDGVELKENIEEEPEDIFAEENVKEKLEEIEEKQEELIEKADELMEKDMQLQEEAQALEEEAKALEDEAKALEEEAEEAYANNDQEAIEEIEQKFQQLDEERQQIDQGFQEIDEQYEELDENFEELNNEFFAMDEELQEVFQDGPMVVRVPEDGPGYNEDNDVFNVPEDQQIDINVEEFLAEEKQNALQNNEFAQEANDFFNNQEVQEALPDNIDQNVQDMMIIGAGNLDEYFVGAGAGIETPEDFYAEDPMEDFYNIVDNNEELYYAEQDAQDWMDDLIEDLAAENNINVAPWLDMPNDVTVSEADAKTSGKVVGYVYGSDANGDPLTFSIFDDPTGALSISGNTITWDGTFSDITSNTDYSVLLKVQDPYGASDVDAWGITVTASAGPDLTATSTVSMAENASDGATVADIDHTGGDGAVTYSITAGNSEGKFSINSSTGVITYNTQAAVLTTETFESTTEGATPTGWTGATVDSTTYYGNILGRFNGDSNTGQDVYKTFDFDSSHANKRVQIDFNFWEFGTWDAVNHGSLDQRFMVYVNDTLVVQDLRRYTGNNQQKYGETVGNLGTGWTPLPKESGMATLNSHQEGELYRLYGTLDGNGDIKLGFGARLDESLSNESAAVDNIKISLTDLNYEDATSHTLTITATDASNNTDTVTQLITVTDVNEAPYFIDNVYAARSIDENGSSGTDVARVHAEDLEGDAITYSITGGNTDNKFTINSSNGLIETAGALDYETTSSYTLTVTATDEHNATGTTTITVNVGNDTSDDPTNDPAAWVTAGDGSAGAYKQTIAYAGTGDGAGQIQKLGHTAAAYNASNISNYDVVWYLNQSNGGFSSSPLSSTLTNWVDAGGVLIMHDRYVNDSQLDSNLPGHNGNVTTTRSFVTSGNQSSSYQIVDETTSNLLKYGPGGIMVDDTSSFANDTTGDHSGNTWQGTFNIGGGNGTNHGYMTNLDSDVLGLATNNTTTQYVDAVWEYGSGAVYYSTTPTDYYIGSGHVDNDAWDAYALNSLHYASSLIFDGYSQINGTGSSEKIYATADDDIIYAGQGSDTLWGGQGDDVFKYDATVESNSSNVDTILDFNKDEDSIDISAITSGASISRTLTNNTRFKLDIDNNGTYDMEFELSGYTGTADDVTVTT